MRLLVLFCSMKGTCGHHLLLSSILRPTRHIDRTMLRFEFSASRLPLAFERFEQFLLLKVDVVGLS